MSEISHVIPNFDNPEWLIATAAVILVGMAVDLAQSAHERKFITELVTEDGPLVLADPDMAKIVSKESRKITRRERAAMWAGVGFLGLGGMQLANPITHTSEVHGGATLVMNVNYSANAQDMADGNSRYSDTINGAYDAAEQVNVPFTFILSGSSAVSVDHQPATHKDMEITGEKIKKQIKPTFRIGDSIANGAQIAVGNVGEGTNNVILITSNLPTSPTNEVSELKTVRDDTTDPSIKMSAIIVGENPNAEVRLGNQSGAQTLPAPIDVQDFRDILGSQNVVTANSQLQIEHDIEMIANSDLISTTEHEQYWPLKAALGLGAIGALMAFGKRSRGIFKKVPKNDNKGEI